MPLMITYAMNDPILKWLQKEEKAATPFPMLLISLELLIRTRESEIRYPNSDHDRASQYSMAEEMSQLELVAHNAPIEDQEEDEDV